MIDPRVTLKVLTLSGLAAYATFLPVRAQEVPPEASGGPEVLGDAEQLLNRLSTLTADDADEAGRLSREIQERWTHSGSVAMDLLLMRGKDAIEAGEYDRAVVHLTALTDHAPGFAEGWNQRATAFFMQDRLGEALSDIEQVLILEPRHFGALTGLGIILEQLGEPEAALRAFRAVQAIHPAEPQVNDAIERLERQTGGRTL